MHHGQVQKTLLLFLGVGSVMEMVRATIPASAARGITWWSFLAPAVFALLCSLLLSERAPLSAFRRGARSPAEREAMLRALMRSQNNCEMPMTQSLFLPGTAAAMTGAVTGEYLAHTDALNAALQQTNGSPAAFSPIVEAALVNASSLPQDDLNVVAAVASVAMASAYDWQAISNGDMPPPAMQSLFRFQLQPIALADVGGCILGMIVAERSSWGNLASSCALGAFTASFGKFFL